MEIFTENQIKMGLGSDFNMENMNFKPSNSFLNNSKRCYRRNPNPLDTNSLSSSVTCFSVLIELGMKKLINRLQRKHLKHTDINLCHIYTHLVLQQAAEGDFSGVRRLSVSVLKSLDVCLNELLVTLVLSFCVYIHLIHVFIVSVYWIVI